MQPNPPTPNPIPPQPPLPTPPAQNFLKKVPKPVLLGGVIVMVSILILTAVALLSGRKAPSTAPSPTPKSAITPIKLTSLQMATKTAQFLDKSASSSGQLILQYACDRKMPIGCSPQDHEGPSSQIILAYLDLAKTTGDAKYKQKADSIMEYYYQTCLNNSAVCEYNFRAFLRYFEDTKDEKYKEAVLKMESAVMADKDLLNHVLNDDGDKLAVLFNLTQDQRYSDRLKSLTDQFLAGDFARAKENVSIYKEGAVEVKALEPFIVAYFYLPAYEIFQDQKYLDAATNFFDAAKMEEHTQELKKIGNSYVIIVSMDALLEISGLEKGKNYTNQVTKLAQFITSELWDSGDRKKFNGDFGFLHGYNKDYNNKFTVNNGWLVRLFLKLPNQTFTIN